MEIELQVWENEIHTLCQVRRELRIQRRDIDDQRLERLALLLDHTRLDADLLAIERHRLPAFPFLHLR